MPIAPLFILLFLALATHAQEQQKRVAILNTEDDGEPHLEFTDLNYINAKLREIAGNTLPEDKYFVMTTQSIIDKMGSKENAQKVCKEATCMAEVGRKISADYIGQARLGRIGGNLTISMELYHSARGNLLGSFTGNAKDVFGLLAIIDEKALTVFRKMPDVSVGSKTVPSAPSVASGISGLQKTTSYEADEEKLYVVNLSTEPTGAFMSFDGVPVISCPKTPCKAELAGGNVRIIAALDQYERADTTVLIKQNNQSISIKLKSSFGVLEIKPAYLDGIGQNSQWNLTINGKPSSSWENKLSQNKYSVKLSHECYENISFDVGINKGKREVFDMAGNITLKKGGLTLSAERNGEPASEPVFVNGKQVGETPFSGSVPLCAKVEIGKNREVVDVKLKYNEKIKHTHRFNNIDMEDLYNTYRTKYVNGEYAVAYNGMKKIYESVKTGELAENSLYWMAMCMLDAGKKENAEILFRTLLDKFPQSVKVCPVEFKLANMAEEAKDKAKQIAWLQKLLNTTHCKNSNESFRAADILPGLQKEPKEQSFTDFRDNKTYKIVKIGNQTWMAENLSYNAIGSKCYDNQESNCQKYGRLYYWETAKSACLGLGWHLPSHEEWETLTAFVGGAHIEGKVLKAKSGWNNNGNGEDKFGFSALPGGAGNSDGSFSNVGYSGYWWTASDNIGYPYYRRMSYDIRGADWYFNKGYLLSVRCLRDY
ncbi:MAG: hypothetical protein FWF63_09340 [Fibromonadales bacterium]|nr:hypothetical protein [Fibromonadales bacterium]